MKSQTSYPPELFSVNHLANSTQVAPNASTPLFATIESLSLLDLWTFAGPGGRIGDRALIENRKLVHPKPQSRRVEGCASTVRWRDRQSHAFAP